MHGDQVAGTLGDDILQRAYEAAVDKYHQMVDPARRDDLTLVGQTAVGGKASLDQQASVTANAQEQADTAPQQPEVALKRTYTKDELLDIAELSQAAGNPDILPSLKLAGLLHDQSSRQQTKKNHNHSQKSQLLADPNRSTGLSPAVLQPDAGSQQTSIDQSQQDNPTATQASQQQPGQSEQYSQADWDAYWQYYGYSAAPPPPPPVPQLCPNHVKLLEQMLSASTEQSQAAPDAVPAAATASSARHALQTRAQGIQGGALSDLLMAWFDAGYHTGKHEAQSQTK